MGHTSTRNGSAEQLLMVPNTSHRKVMKPSHRSTSDCCSSSRQAKGLEATSLKMAFISSLAAFKKGLKQQKSLNVKDGRGSVEEEGEQ
ncbi:hypothetical protein EYF80_062770 [Liparis tanakae]|uniref:Uncharacterized protein n=1 Tax=Liparis tanakae TaxID=230148 RepID=A0A4Z2EDX9_9TELE|nr:hypothetical protein EYF80_062770 [Liparis tanakae]